MLSRSATTLALLGCLSLPTLGATPGAATGNPWADMDYGPFLTASIEGDGPGTNIACKGIAIRLSGTAADSDQDAVVFDTDLLRYASGWTGQFVALKGVVFDGEHWAYPRIDGEQVFGNAVAPGWGRAGSFTDPREYPYGPLPRDWAHWKGLYLHGQKVVLSYSVAQTAVLELPGLERAGDIRLFTRTLELGPSDDELELQLAQDPAWRVGLQRIGSESEPSAELAADATPIFLPADPPVEENRRPGAETNAPSLAWTFDEGAGRQATALAGGPAFQIQNAHWAPGTNGTALELRGDGVGEAPLPGWVEFRDRDLTVSAWIRTEADGVIWSEAPAAGPWVPNAKALFVRDGHLVFDVGWVGAVEGAQRCDQGRWVHVAMVWQQAEAQVTLYVNGRQDGRGTLRPTGTLDNRVLRVGLATTNFPATPWFRGQLDDLRIHCSAITDAALRTLAGIRPATPPILVAGGVGLPDGARWRLAPGGALRLRLPPSAASRRFKVLLGRADTQRLNAVAMRLQATPRAEPLEPLTHGGPARWPESLKLQGQLGTNSGPFVLDAISWPADNPWHSWMRFGGFDFFGDGRRAAISTWSGDVWIVDGLTDSLESLTWRRFATGLYQPLGLRVVDDEVYVLGRDQITRLRDLNNDGEADAYENFNNDTLNTEHFHEFALDLQTDADGNFLYMKAARHARDALHPHHGTLMKVSRDGSQSEVVARGFRAPNGLGVGPQGEAYTTDQEGYWMPANRLNLIRPGGFHGNTWAWWPGTKPTTFEPPICWIHPKIDRSPSTMLRIPPDAWQPLRGQLLSLSYGVGRIFLVPTETVDGSLQGGVTPLPLEFETGIMRARFHPRDGQLYVCGLFGWAGNKTQPGGFHRVRFTGKPLHMPVELHATHQGILLGFSEPLDPASASDLGNYSVERWNYLRTQNYGSPDYKLNGEKGRDRLDVRSARLSPDKRQVFLELPDMKPVMQMHLQLNLRAADGAPVQTFVHHTVHRLGTNSPAWTAAPPAPSSASGPVQLRREITGLKQTLRTDTAAANVEDHRVARLIQVIVPTGTAPSPFLPPGPFTSRWTGFLRLDVSDSFRFHAVGTGRVEVRINGEPAIAPGPLSAAATPGPLRTLHGGLNPIEVVYQSPGAAEARLRVFWSNDTVAAEPLPPGVLVHEAADAELEQAQLRRLGRELFATRHCASCHALPAGFTNSSEAEVALPGMPELRFAAASLEAAGDRFQADWIRRWLADPGAMIEGAWMPRCLPADPQTAAAEAADIAAFLATLRGPTAPAAALPNDADQAQGLDLFNTIGCNACHLAAGEPRLDADDDRRTLAHLPAKWQPAALREFLLAPARLHPGSRMPDFKLSATEANALTAHLLHTAPTPPAPTSSTTTSEGDADRGHDLVSTRGCVQCHAIPGIAPRQFALPLSQLAARSPTHGCLGETVEARGQAPEFDLDSRSKTALRTFLEHDTATLAQDVPAEFYQRQFQNLRCHACHTREDTRDFWSRLESLSAAAKPKVANPYDDQDPGTDATIHRQRPPLTWAGEKLRVDWMERQFLGDLSYKPRPKLVARMPAFAAYAHDLALGLAMDHGLTAAEEPEGPVLPLQAAAGRDLVRKGALSCVDCHALGDQPALAGADTVTINFLHVPDRLRLDYYRRYLLNPQRYLPGTMMPTFVNDLGQTGITNHFGGDARKQFDAIRHFMRSLK